MKWKNILADRRRIATPFEIEYRTPCSGDIDVEKIRPECKLELNGCIPSEVYFVQCYVSCHSNKIPVQFRHQEYSFMSSCVANAVRKSLLDFDRFFDQINALPRIVKLADLNNPNNPIFSDCDDHDF